MAVSDRIQDEDVDICESVQRGLRSRAYGMGRLSVGREGAEHLFHRLSCGGPAARGTQTVETEASKLQPGLLQQTGIDLLRLIQLCKTEVLSAPNKHANRNGRR